MHRIRHSGENALDIIVVLEFNAFGIKKALFTTPFCQRQAHISWVNEKGEKYGLPNGQNCFR